MKRKILALIGVIILLILAISYFINIDLENGANYITKSSILGVIIFYNPFIFALYILIALILILKGIRG